MRLVSFVLVAVLPAKSTRKATFCHEFSGVSSSRRRTNSASASALDVARSCSSWAYFAFQASSASAPLAFTAWTATQSKTAQLVNQSINHTQLNSSKPREGVHKNANRYATSECKLTAQTTVAYVISLSVLCILLCNLGRKGFLPSTEAIMHEANTM